MSASEWKVRVKFQTLTLRYHIKKTLPEEHFFSHLVARTSNKNGQHFYFSDGHADTFLKLQQYFLDYHIVHSSVNILVCHHGILSWFINGSNLLQCENELWGWDKHEGEGVTALNCSRSATHCAVLAVSQLRTFTHSHFILTKCETHSLVQSFTSDGLFSPR